VRRGDVRAGAPVEVRLPGGALEITVSPDLARVTMRGPAERVFTGEADL
jgi:diaminopimelate epimerase